MYLIELGCHSDRSHIYGMEKGEGGRVSRHFCTVVYSKVQYTVHVWTKATKLHTEIRMYWIMSRYYKASLLVQNIL